MTILAAFEKALPLEQQKIFRAFKAPHDIQIYLDALPYIAEELDRSPLRVMTDGQAHCLDGGIFAALALSRLGFRPLIIDLVPEPGADDDHVLAIFQVDGSWGALAKSNYVGLRYRDPVYKNLRELVMSYFEQFFNAECLKTLRGYTRPLDLARFAQFDWMTTEAGVRKISRRLYSLKPVPVVTPKQIARLALLDERSYAAGTLGTNFDWSYGGKLRQDKH